MSLKCKNKIAIVTGCTNGIGLATVKKLVEEGANVYMLCRRVDVGQEIADKLNAKGPGNVKKVVYFEASDISIIEESILECYKDSGRIDIFINNAIDSKGCNAKDNTTIADTSHKTAIEIVESIVGVTAACMNTVIPLMIKSGGGSIVNNSSITSLQADVTRSYYGAAKSMVNMITKDTALQYGRDNIRCNAVLPGFTASEATQKHLPKSFVESWLKHAPLRRLGKAEDQANAIVFFASDESSWITGQILEVSGGYGLGSPMYGDIVDNKN